MSVLEKHPEVVCSALNSTQRLFVYYLILDLERSIENNAKIDCGAMQVRLGLGSLGSVYNLKRKLLKDGYIAKIKTPLGSRYQLGHKLTK